MVFEGLLFKRGDSLNPGFKLCVPRSQVKELGIAHHQDFGHFGKAKTYNHMRQRFYWPRMPRHIRQIVASCDFKNQQRFTKFGSSSPSRSAGLYGFDRNASRWTRRGYTASCFS